MKLGWCPETASKALTGAVNTLADRDFVETDIAQMISAIAGGRRAKLLVEVWVPGISPATSIGLTSAARYMDGLHICIVPDQQSAVEYEDTLGQAGGTAVVMVGEAEVLMRELEGVEMLVVDLRRKEALRVISEARAGPRGMVVVCKGGGPRRSAQSWVVMSGTQIVKSSFVPIGRGIEILHVGVGKGSPKIADRRWIRHVDHETGKSTCSGGD